MRQLRTIVSIAIALSALGAVLAAGAQAQIGPFWKVCEPKAGGKFKDSKCKEKGPPEEWESLRLEAGKQAEIKAKAAANFVLEAKKKTITCKKLKLEKGSTINGSTGENFGFSLETIIFEECAVTGEGTENCKPYSERVAGMPEVGNIATAPLTNKLAFPEKTLMEGEKLLVLFTPTTGAVFAKIKFMGKGCLLPAEVTDEGSVAGEAWQGGAAVLLLKEGLAVVNEVNFPAAAIKQVFLEEAGVKKEVAVKLTLGGAAATFKGRSQIELASGEAWGVFS